MKIYFARHGESQANRLHEISNRGLRHGLTPRGRDQAVELARQLRGRPLARIYSSPLLRAIETSVILSYHLGLEYEVVDALREYDCGIAEGRADDAAWQMWQELIDAWTIHGRYKQRIEGGESFLEVRARFVPFIEGLVQQYAPTDTGIVCVAHGGLYRMMLPLVLPDGDDPSAGQGFDYAGCRVGSWAN